LRGDLVEIDTLLSEGEVDVHGPLTRHMQGTLDEDVAALAAAAPPGAGEPEPPCNGRCDPEHSVYSYRCPLHGAAALKDALEYDAGEAGLDAR
jgi:hypothetical protein